MRHIRKIFESTKDRQLEDVEDIFTEYTDVKYTGSDGEEYSDCHVEPQSTHVLVTIYSSLTSPNVGNIAEFDSVYVERSGHLNLMKRIKTALIRLSHLGYKWGFSFDDEAFFIQVYYKDIELTLHDAFGGRKYMRFVDENIMKDVLKNKYGVEYTSSHYKSEISGYYGQRAEIHLYFKNAIQDSNALMGDLRKITKTVKYLVPDEEREERAFYEVELCGGGSFIKIKL